MNWVGGSRKRFLTKNDAKKQREFFEKRKMHQKLKNSGTALPASPRRTSATSMDLVTLFIVNQIASKKEIKDPPKVAVFGSSKAGTKHGRNEPLVLPMSPGSPSQLSFVQEDQPQYSVQGARNRKHVIPAGFKRRQLSPVLESAFSDSSAPDYLPRLTDTLSPFCSSASSGQGIFPLDLQQRSQTQAELPPRRSPSPWDTSGLDQTVFQQFSQPRGITDSIPWSCGSNRPFFQVETPTAAQVLFRSPEPDNQARHAVPFSLHQSEDTESMLDFTLNQSESEHQFAGEIFRGFTTEECEREASSFGRGKKIYLKDEALNASSTPQTVPDSQCMEEEGSNYVHPSNCSDASFSCLEHNGPVNGCEYSPSYSCTGGYSSSDSCDDEECCQLCPQAASSHVDQACREESLTPNLDSQGNQRPLTPLLKPQMNFRDNHTVMENISFQGKVLGSNAAEFASPQTPISESCKCKKASGETRDAETQTVDDPAAETRDAQTQCGVGSDSCRPPVVDASVQHPATGRQTDTAAEPSAHTPPSGVWWMGEKHTPWTAKTSKFTDSRVIPQRPINPFREALSSTDGRGKENRENSRLMKDLATDAREEEVSLSEEAKTLQEIADILLLLKQRKEVTK